MASYAEVVAYLATVPGAAPAWAEPLTAARLSLATIRVFMETMASDGTSPLREAEEGILSKEIVRMSCELGEPVVGGPKRMKVRLKMVLSIAEQARVTRLVRGFCQPEFVATARFSKTNHGVMRAGRRAVAAYLYGSVSAGERVLEVGPDVRHFVSSTDTDRFAVGGNQYVGARVAIEPRDVIRMQWGELLTFIAEGGEAVREALKVKAGMVESGVMRGLRVEDIRDQVDGIISVDANYDVTFSGMPGVMARTRAKWWRGVMCRAKGLTATTKLKEGRLELMGASWRVDWQAGRIDFRHSADASFGYSHTVDNYLQYEECNGYVWHGVDAHYVYSKGPETNDELLFFSVHRVHYPMDIMEPSYVAHPQARKLRLQSVWAVGDEVSGVPTAFDAVTYHVDALNFSKVLEKRRALDYKGDFAVTLNLVRSTNVVFFLNGTPVGAAVKIEARLAEATALVVEVLAAESRLETNLMFDKAMAAFELDLARSSWLVRCLESWVNMRAVVGAVVGPVYRAWECVRAPFERAALASVKKLRVSYELEPEHLALPAQMPGVAPPLVDAIGEECRCAELISRRKRAMMLRSAAERERELRAVSMALAGECVCERVQTSAFDAAAVGKGELASAAETDDSSSVSSGDTCASEDSTEASSVEEGPGVRVYVDDDEKNSVERQAMEEVIEICELQMQAVLSEVRVDAQRIWDKGLNETTLAGVQTLRTSHVAVEFMANKSVRFMGAKQRDVSAVYDVGGDRIVPVTTRRGTLVGPSGVPLRDGWYYTNNHLRVWNQAEIIAAVQYALDGCVPAVRRQNYNVVLGVPGAGKTYRAAEDMAGRMADRPDEVLFVGTTKAAVAAAQRELVARGVAKNIVKRRCMTLDRYLIHKKTKARFVYADEAPAEHVGKHDAVAAVTQAEEMWLYGDAKQVAYSPYIAGYVPRHHAPGDTIPEERYQFLGETHRNSEDVCAAWLHEYPYYYPCACHRAGEKNKPTMFAHRVQSFHDIAVGGDVRVCTYRQDEKEEVRAHMFAGHDADALREREVGGLATVNEDQGTTRPKVCTIRPFADYDKNQSEHNPSLHNKANYVLSNTTRHVERYDYYSACAEHDGVFRAVDRSRDPERLRLVREKKGMRPVRLQTLWS